MNKYFRTLLAIAVVILIAVTGSVQASQTNQIDDQKTLLPASAYPADRWNTNYIYTDDNAGSDISITFDPDHGQVAWISYFNATYGSLWVAHFVGNGIGNCGPLNSWFCEQVDHVWGESKGWFSSIDVFPDINPDPSISTWKVGVSYYDYSHKSLKYAQYECPPSYDCDWTIYTVNSPSGIDQDNYGQYSSLKFGSTGTPNIAYYAFDVQNEDLYNSMKYAYYQGGGNGNCGDENNWYCESVDTFYVFFNLYLSLDISYGDNVVIAYYDGLNGSLKYAYYAGAGLGSCGTTYAWICQVIDDPTGSNVGLFPSIHAPLDASDYVQIAYYDSTNGKLKYARALAAKR
jgi:hypothetical protein